MQPSAFEFGKIRHREHCFKTQNIEIFNLNTICIKFASWWQANIDSGDDLSNTYLSANKNT